MRRLRVLGGRENSWAIRVLAVEKMRASPGEDEKWRLGITAPSVKRRNSAVNRMVGKVQK